MNSFMSRARNGLYRVLRPVYQRSPMLQRLRQRYLHWKTELVRHAKEEWYSPANLCALQALSARRFDPQAVNSATLVPAPAMWPEIDISVVTYNTEQWVAQFFDSLQHQAYPLSRIHLRLVDHGSSDATIATLEAALAQLEGRLASAAIVRQRNLGFGAGHDRALRESKSEYCLVTNIDLAFRPDSLTTVVAMALHDSQGDVASWELRQIPYEHPKYYDPVTLETNWSSHACILLRRSAYERVGGYEPRIFMYAEDVELSYRFRSFGYALKYVPQAAVHHYTYKSAGEVKPTQFTGSTIGNLYLRLRYGGKNDHMAGLFLYCGLFVMPAPFKGAKKALLKNAVNLLRQWRHFRRGKGDAPAHFPFRAFDYELRRDGAFWEVEPADAGEAPLVSIVTRTYEGRGMFLTQAVRSILNQTYPRLELIVVQDGGDTEASLVQALATNARPGHSLRFIANPKLGRSAAGNAGLAAATGQYIMFLDDDDLLFADHVETLAGVLQKEPGLSAAYALAMEVMTDVAPDRANYIESEFSTPGVFRQEWDHETMKHHNFIPIQAILFKKELYEQRGGFDVELDQLEDWHLWMRYGYRNQFRFVPKTTSMFRSPASLDVRTSRALKLHEAYNEAKKRAQKCFEEIDGGGIR